MQLGTVLDGRYRLVAPLAEGAMGSVYRAERVGLDREVAVKVMHATLPGAMSARERFEREARLMAKLAHPHCLSVIDFGVHEDKPYLVMELVKGQNLADLIAAGRMPVARAADLARQTLAGIAHAHSLDIIHRDIKPANIMVSPKEALGDHVQILDFGLARLRESSSLLTDGLTVGTPSYMAPEQCRGAKLDARVDLYAVGVVIYEMVTGSKPFAARDPLEIVKKHLTEPPPRLDGPLGPVVARALAKDPADRYASAVDMAAAIVAAVPGIRAQTAPVGVPVIPDVPTLGSSALVPLDEPTDAHVGVTPDPMLDPSGTRPPAAAPLDPHEASLLRRMLPASRMKWMALFLVILVAGGIYGIVRAKQYLADQSAAASHSHGR
ncbi:MAG: protein kinase domain-containing protein [Acidobacteriota bacterium]